MSKAALKDFSEVNGDGYSSASADWGTRLEKKHPYVGRRIATTLAGGVVAMTVLGVDVSEAAAGLEILTFRGTIDHVTPDFQFQNATNFELRMIYSDSLTPDDMGPTFSLYNTPLQEGSYMRIFENSNLLMETGLGHLRQDNYVDLHSVGNINTLSNFEDKIGFSEGYYSNSIYLFGDEFNPSSFPNGPLMQDLNEYIYEGKFDPYYFQYNQAVVGTSQQVQARGYMTSLEFGNHSAVPEPSSGVIAGTVAALGLGAGLLKKKFFSKKSPLVESESVPTPEA